MEDEAEDGELYCNFNTGPTLACARAAGRLTATGIHPLAAEARASRVKRLSLDWPTDTTPGEVMPAFAHELCNSTELVEALEGV